MHISGTEPSSVILNQTCILKKLKSNDPKMPKQTEAKRHGVITHKITISINFKHRKCWCSRNVTNQPKSTVELGYMALRDSLVHQQWHPQSSWKSNRDFYQDVYTSFNRIKLTIWTICTFRVLNPHQWSTLKSWKVMTKKCQNKLRPKWMV